MSVLSRDSKCIFLPPPKINLRYNSNGKRFWSFFNNKTVLLCTLAGSTIVAFALQYLYPNKDKAISHNDRVVKLTSREKRFAKFASVERDGVIYMTPQDFLESIIEKKPRSRIKRKILSQRSLDKIRDLTPLLNESNKMFFRKLGNVGAIGYTEYAFLLSVLTKPLKSFRTVFDMFDVNYNGEIDLEEFMVIEKIFNKVWVERRRKTIGDIRPCEEEAKLNPLIKCSTTLFRMPIPTTLTIHFFGSTGNRKVNFPEFEKFVTSLQREILEFEFYEYSRGLDVITDFDFARIMLKYAYLEKNEYDEYMTNFMDKRETANHIQMDDYVNFMNFLNSLNDFKIAMSLVLLQENFVSKDNFQRCVRACTGEVISESIINTVFELFDLDNDDQLSTEEYLWFFAIMKDRLFRGYGSFSSSQGWNGFKQCMKFEYMIPSQRLLNI